jgi:hypothetical protein
MAGVGCRGCFVRVRRGDFVRLSVERPLLGLRGAKITAIAGRAE